MKTLWQKFIWHLLIIALIILLASCNGKSETGKAIEPANKHVLYYYSHLRRLEKVEETASEPNQNEDEFYEYSDIELSEEKIDEEKYENSDE